MQSLPRLTGCSDKLLRIRRRRLHRRRHKHPAPRRLRQRHRLMEMAEVNVSVIRHHPSRPGSRLPHNSERRRIPTKRLDLVTMDKQRPVVADLNKVVPVQRGTPLKAALRLRVGASKLSLHPVKGVLPGVVTLPAHPAVVAVHLPHNHPFELREQHGQRVSDKAGGGEHLRHRR